MGGRAKIGQRVGGVLIVALAAVGPAQADVKVASVFGDRMVLQQGMEVPVWGTAEPGERGRVKFRGKEYEIKADARGKWLLRMGPLKAERSQTGTSLVVMGKKNTVTFSDVLVGEVWLCSGQSNMQWNLASSDAADDVKTANFPAIRHTALGGPWSICTPASMAGGTGPTRSSTARTWWSPAPG